MFPSLNADFVRTQRLDHRMSFSRAGTATYFGRDGLLKTAAADEPAFDYDPITRRCRGLLLESSRTNLITNSAVFNTAPWSNVNSSSVSAAATAPDGALTAFKLVEDAAASTSHYVRINPFTSLPTSGSVTVSLYVKAAERSLVRLQVRRADNTDARQQWNLTDLSTQYALNLTATSIVPVGNGWYRLSITFDGVSGATTPYLNIFLADSVGATITYTGDGASGLYLWGVQAEAGGAASSYIPTSGASATRPGTTLTLVPNSRWYQAGVGTLRVKGGSCKRAR